MKGVDFTILKTPPTTRCPSDQAAATAHLHRRKEVLKWRGTARPINNTSRSKSERKEYVKGHVIISEMLHHEVNMIPGTIDPHMSEGQALHWIRYGKPSQLFQANEYDFGNAQGTKVGKEMCVRAMQDPDMCGLIHRANRNWKHKCKYEEKLFGSTYMDKAPGEWSK
eukprot:4482502-Ditylum_brightwellii.AAC.1